MTSWMGPEAQAEAEAPEVVILFHVHELDDGEEDVKIIGVYSGEAEAEAAQVRAATLPGFSDAQEGFQIGGYVVNRDYWTEGFVTVSH